MGVIYQIKCIKDNEKKVYHCQRRALQTWKEKARINTMVLYWNLR
jgi:hypothetical protein